MHGWIRTPESIHNEVSIDSETPIAGGNSAATRYLSKYTTFTSRFKTSAVVLPVYSNNPLKPDNPGL
jgi:hypothetical protein